MGQFHASQTTRPRLLKADREPGVVAHKVRPSRQIDGLKVSKQTKTDAESSF